MGHGDEASAGSIGKNAGIFKTPLSEEHRRIMERVVTVETMIYGRLKVKDLIDKLSQMNVDMVVEDPSPEPTTIGKHRSIDAPWES